MTKHLHDIKGELTERQHDGLVAARHFPICISDESSSCDMETHLKQSITWSLKL